MARRSLTGGVRAKGANRIELEFWFQGTRYRPTILRQPTDANLRRACVRLARIDQAIADGTFNFATEFPAYRLRSRVPHNHRDATSSESDCAAPALLCRDVFHAFLAHCETRVLMSDLAWSTFVSYQQILCSVWTPRLGDEPFLEVRYSRLQSILASYAARTESRGDPSEPGTSLGTPLAKRTYNNLASTVRCAFEFGYKDHPDQHNPALRLKTLRITKKDRAPIDPFTIAEADVIIANSHAMFGAVHGHYEEFRFFTGLRPSEQIALHVTDYDRARGTLSVHRARVRGRDKDRTKTHEDREIALCPRAIAVLERQLALRERFIAAGRLAHALIFFRDDGTPLDDLTTPYRRWGRVLKRAGVRYREPYDARHSFISWSLMIGRNLLKLAAENGHSVQTMLSRYAAWTRGATDEDVAAIERAMQRTPPIGDLPTVAPRLPLETLRRRRRSRRFRGSTALPGRSPRDLKTITVQLTAVAGERIARRKSAQRPRCSVREGVAATQ